MLLNVLSCSFLFLEAFPFSFFSLSVFHIRENQKRCPQVFIDFSTWISAYSTIKTKERDWVWQENSTWKKKRQKDHRSFVISGFHCVVLLTPKARWVGGVGYEILCNILFFHLFHHYYYVYIFISQSSQYYYSEIIKLLTKWLSVLLIICFSASRSLTSLLTRPCIFKIH